MPFLSLYNLLQETVTGPDYLEGNKRNENEYKEGIESLTNQKIDETVN